SEECVFVSLRCCVEGDASSGLSPPCDVHACHRRRRFSKSGRMARRGINARAKLERSKSPEGGHAPSSGAAHLGGSMKSLPDLVAVAEAAHGPAPLHRAPRRKASA